jgi:protein MpaA
MSQVKAAPIDPVALAARLENAAAKAGFRSQVYGTAGSCPLLALTKRTPGRKPRIYLSAGIHGDEPAPPLALLSMIESGDFDARATWFLCPLLNPDGFVTGVRENASGVDLNRDYRHLESPEIRAHVAWLESQPNFDLAICVHEDWETAGFYLYELNPEKRPSLAENMVKAVSKACPIEMSPVIEGREAKGGIIRPSGDPLEREKWPESIYLQAHHTRLSYTIESPSALALETRLAALRTALRTAIGLVTRPRN